MKILIPDKVDPIIKDLMEKKGYEIDYKPGMELEDVKKAANSYDALIVRSFKLHEVKFNGCVYAIGRAGAGVNNIPVEKCAELGIVVFNAPGANANAVKELVLCSLILASRNIYHGIEWTKRIENDIVKTVEKHKSLFKGNEIRGKKLAVIGLGAIGVLISNAAESLGMHVTGYDPYITVENAWKLSGNVNNAENINKAIADADYITIHVPYNEHTNNMVNSAVINKMKRGVKLLNFARGELVEFNGLKQGLDSGVISKYITDFPDERFINDERVIIVPHLGASTHEAEENCAVMIAAQVDDFLKNGNIKNSVNYPATALERNGGARITLFNKNIPGIVSRISEVLGENKINIHGMINKSKGDYAYNIIDIDGAAPKEIICMLRGIEGVIKVRVIG